MVGNRQNQVGTVADPTGKDVGGLRLEAENQNVQASNLQPLTYYLLPLTYHVREHFKPNRAE